VSRLYDGDNSIVQFVVNVVVGHCFFFSQVDGRHKMGRAKLANSVASFTQL
jgi:hypothetical protein